MDTFTLDTNAKPQSRNGKLNADKRAEVLGLWSTVYLVSTIGGEVYDPKVHDNLKVHNNAKVNNLGKKNRKNSSSTTKSKMPNLLDLSFVEDVDDWDAWCSKTGLRTMRPEVSDDIYRRTFTNYKPDEGRSGSSSVTDPLEDLCPAPGDETFISGPPIQTHIMHTMPYVFYEQESTAGQLFQCFNANEGPVVEPKSPPGTTAWDIDHLCACARCYGVTYGGTVLPHPVSAGAGASSVNGRVPETWSDIPTGAFIAGFEAPKNVRNQGCWTDNSPEYQFPKSSYDYAPVIVELADESDEDRESVKVAESF